MPRAVLGQNGLKIQYFTISRPWGPVGQNAKCKKKWRNFGEMLLGQLDFFPKSASSSGKLRFSVFRPEFLNVPRANPRPKWPKKMLFRNYPRLWVRSAKTENVKKLRNFGDKLLGRPDFSFKGASSTGKLFFLYSIRNLSKCQGRSSRPKWP